LISGFLISSKKATGFLIGWLPWDGMENIIEFSWFDVLPLVLSLDFLGMDMAFLSLGLAKCWVLCVTLFLWVSSCWGSLVLSSGEFSFACVLVRSLRSFLYSLFFFHYEISCNGVNLIRIVKSQWCPACAIWKKHNYHGQ